MNKNFPTQTIQPTPYPDVNAVLLTLLNEVRTVLGECFVGLYLYGSLAGGDFNPRSSDIDFLVVTDDYLHDDVIAALRAMHERLWASGLKWALKLEGSYIPRASLRRYNPNDEPFLSVNERKSYVAQHGGEWILQRHLLWECGVIVDGPPMRSMIDPISPEEIRAAVRRIMSERWQLMLENPDPRLSGREYQAFTILTMCRALHTLKFGTVASKPVAGRWAQAEYPQWAGLIERALAWSDGEQADEIAGTLEFLRFTLEEKRKIPTGV